MNIVEHLLSLVEVGKKISKANAAKLRAAMQEMMDLLSQAEDSQAEAAADLITDCIPLTEAALNEAATAHLKLIAPGWGTSGYYSKETLQKAAPVFNKGLKMFWNHQTAAEEGMRPEGDLDHLAGELLEDSSYREDGPAGPGLYARARVFDRFRDAVKDLKDSIGVSIRAYGVAEQGEAEGRKGPQIREIKAAKSVDYVTVPGAGGKALELFESAGRRLAERREDMDKAEVQALIEAAMKPLKEENAALKTDAARLREAGALRDAREFATARLNTIALPAPTRARLAETLTVAAPIKDGVLDQSAFTAAIDEAAKREAEYLQSIGGFGRVAGMGSTAAATEPKIEDVDKQLGERLAALGGLSEAGVKRAMEGREVRL